MILSKKILFSAIALIGVAFSATSCSDDDKVATFSVACTYDGVFTEEKVGTLNDASVITANEDGTYDILVAPSFTLGSAEFGAMTLRKVQLVETEEGYTFQNEANGVKITYAGNEAQRKYPSILEFAAHLDGTLSKSGKLDFTLDLNHANTVFFYYTFAGQK